MNTQTQEALKMAMEEIKLTYIKHNARNSPWLQNKTYQACKEALASNSEALAQPAQEPVYQTYNDWCCGGWTDVEKWQYEEAKEENKRILYTHPAPSNGMDKPLFARVVPWQGLSDDEIETQITSHIFGNDADEFSLDIENIRDFARAIEQALKEKNEHT